MDTYSTSQDLDLPSTMNRRINVLIYGGGAVGSIFGWRLAQQTGVRVSVVCRSNYDAVKRSGFVFETAQWGNGLFKPHQVYRGSSMSWDPPAEQFDYIVCANKVSNGDCSAIVRDLKQVATPQTTFVSAQNGMDVELPLKQAFPDNTVLSAICNIGCSQDHPGFVQQKAGMNPKAFLIGVYGKDRDTASALAKRDILVECDLKFGSVDNICQHRWKKLLFNSVWNATSALTNLNTQEALAHPDALHLATSIAREANRVAIQAGAELEDDYCLEVINLARKAGPTTPSTLQDARLGRVMEIDSIWGYLVQKAVQCRVSIPTIQLVHDLLQHMNTSFVQRQDLRHQLAGISNMAWANPSSAVTPLHTSETWLDDRIMLNEELGRYASTVVA